MTDDDSGQSLLGGKTGNKTESYASKIIKIWATLAVLVTLLLLSLLLMLAIYQKENTIGEIIDQIIPLLEVPVDQDVAESGDGHLQTGPISIDCDRTCTMGDTRTCVFQWKVGYYYSMLTGLNRPCGNCPFNQSDCLRSGCVTLNGISRPVATVNREVPGPKIIVCQGDTIVVNVTNRLEDMTGITFHWHGVRQIRTPAMDGPSMITQCPIPFATTFTYSFQATESGTFFWHSHIGSNRVDGLAGPLIVRSIEDPHQNLYDVDDSSHILFLQDWMNITQSTNFLKYLFDIGENKPDFLLINGQGKGPPFYQGFDEPFFTPRYVLYVERFRRYRLRLINNGFTACPLQVTIDSHELLLIAADGRPIQATSCDGIFMTSGERFDVVIHANQTIGNYWVRLLGLEYECSTCKEFAILRYKGAPETFPLLPESPTAMPKLVANVPDNPPVEFPNTFKFTDLRSLDRFDANVNSMNTHYLPLGFYQPSTNDSALRLDLPQINHITFTFPPVPLLSQHNEVDQSSYCDDRVVSTWTHCLTSQCTCTQTLSAQLNETVEIFLYNQVDDISCHPMHFHGYSVRIVGMGKIKSEHMPPSEVRERDQDGEFPRLETNYAPMKDTFCVSFQSYVILQFVADNPGWWFVHCHLDFHSLMGMAMVIVVGTDDDIKDLIPEHFPRCHNFQP
ncbi:uncharacterized protein [Apostichopus japonicus]|uniref:uncharacterized protein n=1 Tax=Stichopus japonicus TaxID=307972 RepID=UPI003AB54934